MTARAKNAVIGAALAALLAFGALVNPATGDHPAVEAVAAWLSGGAP